MNLTINERVARLDDRYQFEPASYRVRCPDGRTGWTAYAYVIEHRYDESIYHKLFAAPDSLFASKQDADAVAAIRAIEWAERGLPPLPTIG